MSGKWRALTLVVLLSCSWIYSAQALAFVKGIYISQSTAMSAKKMQYLERESKAVGIDTFIIDTMYRNSIYAIHVKNAVKRGFKFVSRIVIFPGGGTHSQVTDKHIWKKKLDLAQYAVHLGASEIQLDYIRYSVKTGSSKEKAYHVNEVIKYFRQHLPKHVKLQIDIFGEAAFKPSNTIGQNVTVFAPSLDAICPMAYPSHYEPFRLHAAKPYNTILTTVDALQRQLHKHKKINIYAYIELYNYRVPMSYAKRISYIRAQIQAARDAGAQGFYVWSARNQYGILFDVLRNS